MFGPTGQYGQLQDNSSGQQAQGMANQAVGFGQQRQLQQSDIAGQNYRAGVAANAQMFPSILKQQRFNQIFPWEQQQFGNLSSFLEGHFPGGPGGGPGGAAGGAFGQPAMGPNINTGPVFNPQQVQSQVNQMRATNDQSAASQLRDTQSRLGGQGYGANSPLAMALAGQIFGSNMATNTGGETSIRNTAAQTNASHQLQAQQAQAGEYQARIGEQLTAQQTRASMLNALIGSLGGLA